MKRQRGYSLIETVAVTTLVGSLGAAAAPRMVDWTTEARVAVVRNMQGAVHSASSLVHMKCVVSARCVEDGEASLPVAGTEVNLVMGYPAGGHAGGIANALEYSGFDTVQMADATTVFRQRNAPDPARCAVIYRSPVADGVAPQISSELSGC